MSFQEFLTVLTLEYEMMQRIFGAKIGYCVVKVECEKFDDKELCDMHHLNVTSVMHTNIYTYIHTASDLICLACPPRTSPGFPTGDSLGFMEFKDTLRGITQSSVWEPNIPGVSTS
jgi:hypothetical protein